MHPLLFQIGPIAVPSYGVFAAFGVIAAMFLSARMARAMGLDANRIWNLCVLMIFTALIGSRVLLVVLNWSDFRRFPLWIVGLTSMRTPWMLVGGGAFALLVGLAYALMVKLPLLRTLDVLTPGLALGYAISRIGSFWAGSAYGSPTDAALGSGVSQPPGRIVVGHAAGSAAASDATLRGAAGTAFFLRIDAGVAQAAAGRVVRYVAVSSRGILLLPWIPARQHHPEIVNGGLLPGQTFAVLLVIASGVFWWKRDKWKQVSKSNKLTESPGSSGTAFVDGAAGVCRAAAGPVPGAAA